MTLSNPAAVQERLEAIEADLAIAQNELEDVAMEHFTAKRNKEKARATRFIEANDGERSVAERTAIAERDTALDGVEAEARYEALRSKVRVLDTRAAIGMSILRAQSRAGA
jgi:hypothetical protein